MENCRNLFAGPPLNYSTRLLIFPATQATRGGTLSPTNLGILDQ